MPNVIITTVRFALAVVAVAITSIGSATAADPSGYLPGGRTHRLLRGDFPPGTLGQARLTGRGPVAGYLQPVAISGPEGTQFALPLGAGFAPASPRMAAGMLIGAVYRFQISAIPGSPGAELFPTIEIIDRTYPPPGLAIRFPIEVVLDQEDFDAALSGQLVTRVIYLEDPQTATPLVQTPETNRPLEIDEFEDPLEVADRLGRPVAIVRIGSVAPPSSPALLPQFYFGYPVWAPIVYPETVNAQSEPAIQP